LQCGNTGRSGTVTTNLDKNRLVEIPPSGGKTPDHGLTESASNPTISSKECTIHLHVNFAYTVGRLEPLAFSFSQNGKLQLNILSWNIEVYRLHDIKSK